MGIRLLPNFQIATIDSNGRPQSTSILIPETPGFFRKADRDNVCQAAVGNLFEGSYTHPELQGGHLIATRFGGWGGRENLVPQDRILNNGPWKIIENKIATCNRIPVHSADLTVEVEYSSSTTIIPEGFRLTFVRFPYKEKGGTSVGYAQITVSNDPSGSLATGWDQKFVEKLKVLGCGIKANAIVIDDTASMGPIIGQVSDSIRNTVMTTELLEDFETTWNLTTFKDDATVRTVTTDRNVLLGAVDNLVAWDGGDCPENVLGGIETAINSFASIPGYENAPNDILVVTDASAQPGDVQALIDKAKMANVRVNVLLTNDCYYDPIPTAAAAKTAPSTGKLVGNGAAQGQNSLKAASASIVGTGYDLSSQVVLKDIATQTGGQYFFVPGGNYAMVQNALNTMLAEMNGNNLIIDETAPANPTVTVSSAYPFSLNVGWTGDSRTKSIQLEKQDATGAFIPVDLSGYAQPFFEYSEQYAIPSTTYTYRVKAINDFGESEWATETGRTGDYIVNGNAEGTGVPGDFWNVVNGNLSNISFVGPGADGTGRALQLLGSNYLDHSFYGNLQEGRNYIISAKVKGNGCSFGMTAGSNYNSINSMNRTVAVNSSSWVQKSIMATKPDGTDWMTVFVQAWAGSSANCQFDDLLLTMQPGPAIRPQPVPSLTATPAAGSKVNLAWGASPDATSYTIERRNGDGSGYIQYLNTVTGLTFSDQYLQAGSTYVYRVTAESATGSSTWVESGVTMPSLPANVGGLVATEVLPTRVTLSWEGVSSAVSYSIDRSVGTGSFSQVGTSAIAAFVDTSAIGNKSYTYRVKSVNSAGSSSGSTVLASTPTGAPTGLSGSSGATTVNLVWTAGSGAASYLIERKSGAQSTFAQVGTSTTTNYGDTGLISSTAYTYRVRSVSTGGNSDYSPEFSISTTAAPIIPVAPVGLSGTATSSAISLTWTASSGATSYLVERKTGPTGTFAQVGTSTIPSFNNTGLSANTTNVYRIRASNSAGTSPSSAEYSKATLAVTPTAPTGLAGSVTSSSVSLTWNASSGATNYLIERKTGSTGTYIQIGTATTNSFNNSGLVANTVYVYRLRASNSSGNSPYSAELSKQTLAPVPAAPSITSATSTTSSITLNWAIVSGATSYAIERKTGPTGTWTQVGTATPATFVNSGLTTKTTYIYRLKAVNGSGSSPYSAEFSKATL